MKASEMTNEELANELMEPLVGSRIVIEAAARLRKVDDYAEMCADAMREVAAIRTKLKVAEDALVVCRDGMCGECHRQHPGETCVCPNGCYEMSMAKNALAAIRDGSSSKRNCDRFDDFSTAKHAWHEECFDYDESSGEWVNPKFPNLTFEEWLFAPCEEGGKS